MSNIQATIFFTQELADAWASFVSTFRVRLAKAPLAVGPNLTYAECTAVECDFTGYNFQTAHVESPPSYFDAQLGVWYVPIRVVVFTVAGSPSIVNDVFAFFVEDTTGPNLVMAGNFSAPYAMQEAGDTIRLTIIATNPGAGVLSATINGNPA